MSTVPRRPRPQPGDRAQTILTQTRGAHSGQGSTAAARPVVTTRLNRQHNPPVGGGAVTTGTADEDGVSISGTAPTGGSSSAPYRSVVIGALAQGDPTAGKAVAIGYGAYVGPSSYETIAIGNLAEATGNDAICIGTANADGANAIAIGVNSNATAGYALALGAGTTASGNSSLALGVGAQATGPTSVGIINNSSTGHNSFAFGPSADATADEAIAFGSSSQASGVNSWASSGATASGDYSIAMGTNGTTGALAANDFEIALGMSSHIAIIKGKLVIADGSGGLHQIVVSTGGALSTVAYP